MGFTDLTWIQNPTLGSFRRIIRAGGRAGGGRAGRGSVCDADGPGPAPLRRAPHRLSISVPPRAAPRKLLGTSPLSGGQLHPGHIPAQPARLPRRDAVASFAGSPRGDLSPPAPPQPGLPPEGLLCRPPPSPARLPASTHHITDGGDVSDSH